MIYRITLRLTTRRGLAAAAAFLVALDVRITVFEYLLMTEILAIFLSVSLIHAMSRALLDNSRLSAALAAACLLALALTKVVYVALPFLASALLALLAWRFREAAMSASLRRCAVGLSIVAVLIAGKLATCYYYTGMVSSNSGATLQQFLSLNPAIVLRLPDGDPALAKFKASYAEHGSFLLVAERFDNAGVELSRATSRIYVRAVLGDPLGAMKAALKAYYRQTSQNHLFIYPEETNVRAFKASRNVLFAIERSINAAIFGSWPSVIWNSLCLLLGTLCLVTRMPASSKVVLALLLGFIIYTIGASTWTFGGYWRGDNSRMRLMYEAPLIALWIFVPYRVFMLGRSPDRWRGR